MLFDVCLFVCMYRCLIDVDDEDPLSMKMVDHIWFLFQLMYGDRWKSMMLLMMMIVLSFGIPIGRN